MLCSIYYSIGKVLLILKYLFSELFLIIPHYKFNQQKEFFMNVLMVCLGNICRSPMAEGILKSKIKNKKLNWSVDSAGTSGWHIGEYPDRRGMQLMRERGIDISDQRSRKFVQEDFAKFDLILAMDQENYQDIIKLAPQDRDRQKVKMILNFAFPNENKAVPDPYYDNGFEKVFDLLDKACSAIIEANHS